MIFFLANPLEVLRGLMNNGFLIICMFKKEVRARIDAYYIWARFCVIAASQKAIWYFHLFSISCATKIPSTTNEKQYGNKQTLCLNFKFRVQQMKSIMATSRCCVWISNSEYNKWKAIWQQADAVFEFQIPSATNEEQYGENLLLLLLLLSIREKRKTMRA